MKKTWILIVTVMLTFSLASGAHAKMTLKLGMPAPPTHPHTKSNVMLAEYVKAKTNGEITIDVFPMSQLGGERSMVEQVQGGTLEMADITTAVLSNFVPEVSFFDLPFLFPTRGLAYSVLNDSEFWKIISAAFPQKGFAVIGYGENEIRDFTNTKREVRKPEDIKGLKVRVMESPVYLETWKTLGASAVGMPFGEVYNALQQGVIDAQENPIMTSVLMKFTEVTPYVTILNYSLTATFKIVNLDIWNQLKPEQQEIFYQGAQMAMRAGREGSMKLTGELVAELEKSGKTKVVRLTPEERLAFRKAVQPVYDKLEGKMGTIPNKPEFGRFAGVSYLKMVQEKIEQYQ
jgi:tripartite ATP-independent transporter DctP family solute receptor